MGLTDTEIRELEAIYRQESREKAAESFYHYCKILSPDFYRDDRPHLVYLCEILDKFAKGLLIRDDGKPYKRLMINMPPQHGKSRTLINFCQWLLGRNNRERIITASYNDGTASDFSRYTRDGIISEKNIPEDTVFSDIFPKTTIKQGNSSFEKWALTGQHFNYLGAGVMGSITSKGGTVLIVDDPIKDAESAMNENHLDKIWTWYTGTFLSRVSAEGGEPLEVIVQTRWSKKDPCGRILDSEDADTWFIVKMTACNEETGEMLCPSLLNTDRYEYLKRIMVPEIFRANYQQEPLDLKGVLYTDLKTYNSLPMDEKGNIAFEKIISYTDTADEGSDYLCSIVAGVFKGQAFILDVIYSKEPMEVTEPLTAEMFLRNKVNEAKIESNNGGRGFARNVERILYEKYKTRKTVIKWFHQSQNKLARIITNSSFVQQNIFFPEGWHYRYSKFYEALSSFVKEGQNKNDDGPDAITGIAEMMDAKGIVAIKSII